MNGLWIWFDTVLSGSLPSCFIELFLWRAQYVVPPLTSISQQPCDVGKIERATQVTQETARLNESEPRSSKSKSNIWTTDGLLFLFLMVI